MNCIVDESSFAKVDVQTPWRYDGHGINDANGNRLAKVQGDRFVDRDAASLILGAATEMQRHLNDMMNDPKIRAAYPEAAKLVDSLPNYSRKEGA